VGPLSLSAFAAVGERRQHDAAPHGQLPRRPQLDRPPRHRVRGRQLLRAARHGAPHPHRPARLPQARRLGSWPAALGPPAAGPRRRPGRLDL